MVSPPFSTTAAIPSSQHRHTSIRVIPLSHLNNHYAICLVHRQPLVDPASLACISLPHTIFSPIIVIIRTTTELPLLVRRQPLLPHRQSQRWSFIPLILFQISRITFLLFLRWRKINIAHGLSSSASMPSLIEFYIILFPLRARNHWHIPTLLSKNNGLLLTLSFFNGYIL